MTTQDLYFGIQTGLQLLIGGGVVWAVIWLSGVLKRAIESQEKTIAAQAEQMKALKTTIDAQAEQMKAQSMVSQDVERLYKMMQQVIAFVDPEAQLQREQAFRAQLEREAAIRPMRERIEAWYAAVRGDGFDRRQFANSEAYATLKHYLPEALQQEIDRSRDPFMVVALRGIDPLQVRLLEEIAKLER